VRSEAEHIVRVVDKLINALAINDAVQIVSLPSWLDVVTVLRNQCGFPILYDCHDYLPGFQRLARAIINAEPLLFERCDQVMFSAQYLMDLHISEIPALASKALLLRNANDPEDFVMQNGSIAPRARRRVGYAGSLDHWFDVELIRKIAAMHPHLEFVLAGRIEDNRIRQLQHSPNVQFTGEIPYASVPGFLQNCDAGIIPFCRIPLTLATNPIKVYEYFSAGLPVVSTRLPEVELYKELVYIADTAEQFGSFLCTAVDEESAPMRQRRIATAQHESWRNRADALLKGVPSSRRLICHSNGSGKVSAAIDGR
jgi:glycosyltransferase involved in cell wall biosynthesis